MRCDLIGWRDVFRGATTGIPEKAVAGKASEASESGQECEVNCWRRTTRGEPGGIWLAWPGMRLVTCLMDHQSSPRWLRRFAIAALCLKTGLFALRGPPGERSRGALSDGGRL